MSKTFGIGFTVGAALSPTVATVFSTVEQKIKASAGRMESLTAKAKAYKTVAELEGKRNDLGRTFAAGGGKDALVGQQLAAVNRELTKARSAAEKYGPAVGGYAAAHAKAEREILRTESALKKYTATKQASEKRQELRGRMVDAIAPVAAIALPVRSAINFESAMADAAKTIEGMRDEAGNLTPAYYQMEAAVKRMGRSLPLTHEELARLFAAGGQEGFTATKDLEEFTTMSAHMSVAFGMGTDEAANSIGGYRTALKMSMPEVRSMLDLMNQYANTGSASEKGIADIVRRVGSLGNVGGVAAKPMTALAATLDSMKVAPDKAATGIKNLILAMTSGTAATKEQKKAFASLRDAQGNGINTESLAKQMQVDGPNAIISVLESIKRLPKHQQLSVMQEIFGKESLDSIAPLLDQLDLVKKNLRIAADETAYAGAMQKEFENRSKTTANAIVLAKNRVGELGINLGSVLLPPLVSVLGVVGGAVSLLADFAQEHQTLTTVVMTVATGFVALKVSALAAMYAGTLFSGASVTLGGTLIKLPPLMRLVGMAGHAMLGPLGIFTAAVALAAGWITQNWETAGPVVMGVWEDLKSAAADFGAEFQAVFVEPIKSAFAWLDEKIPLLGDALRGIASWFGDGDDKKQSPVPPAEAVEAQGADKNTAAQSTAQLSGEKPGQAASPPPSTAAAKREAEAASTAPAPAASAAAPASARRASATAPAGPSGVTAQLNFSLNGIPDAALADKIMKTIDQRKSELERLVSGMVNDAVRLAYGS